MIRSLIKKIHRYALKYFLEYCSHILTEMYEPLISINVTFSLYVKFNVCLQSQTLKKLTMS